MENKFQGIAIRQISRQGKRTFVGEDTNQADALLSSTNGRYRAVVCARFSRREVRVNFKAGILTLCLKRQPRRQGQLIHSLRSMGFLRSANDSRPKAEIYGPLQAR